MSDVPNTPNAAIATEVTGETNASHPEAPKKAPRAKKPLIVPAKIQKKLESLQSKIEKLSTDNKTLKSQLSHLKTSNTRIRRIPKNDAPAESA